MLNHFRPALILLLGFSILTGVVYPLVVTGIAQLAMPRQSAGSLVTDNGVVVGSSLIGQSFAADKYFHGRPSAAGNGYDATSSSGSNLGPTSKKLHDRIAESMTALKAENPGAPVPAELVYASASGLDPDVSPATAAFQIPRLMKIRGVTSEQLQALIAQNTRYRTLGLLGEPTVNVLALNRALDALAPVAATAPAAAVAPATAPAATPEVPAATPAETPAAGPTETPVEPTPTPTPTPAPAATTTP